MSRITNKQTRRRTVGLLCSATPMIRRHFARAIRTLKDADLIGHAKIRGGPDRCFGMQIKSAFLTKAARAEMIVEVGGQIGAASRCGTPRFLSGFVICDADIESQRDQ